MNWTVDISGWLPYISVVLPIVIGIIVKASLSERAKAVIMLVATAVVALVNQVTESAGVLSGEGFQAWGFALVITISTYYGVWKPLGLGNVFPEAGIGPGTISPTHTDR